MTNKQAWFKVGKTFLTPREERTSAQKESTDFGLCWAYDESRSGDSFNRSLYMLRKKFNIENYNTQYWIPVLHDRNYKPLHDELRGLFALFMAEAWDDLT